MTENTDTRKQGSTDQGPEDDEYIIQIKQTS